jgi:hypothetical protein
VQAQARALTQREGLLQSRGNVINRCALPGQGTTTNGRPDELPGIN